MLSARDQFLSSTTSSTAGIGLGVEIVSSSQQPPVYSSTTMPLVSSNGHMEKTNGRTPANSPVDTQIPKIKSVTDNGRFSNLPSRNPIDMEFKNLSLTVKLGFRKGK